ncbi:hypothetical protein [Streptomyces sp. NPDC051636]|uniref:hypothetical protein n=1 Tax=Streptomyces sp. NPDC051636 TaxID=3365663 RepID=UPI0037A10FB3
MPAALRAPGGRGHEDHLVPGTGNDDGGVITHGPAPLTRRLVTNGTPSSGGGARRIVSVGKATGPEHGIFSAPVIAEAPEQAGEIQEIPLPHRFSVLFREFLPPARHFQDIHPTGIRQLQGGGGALSHRAHRMKVAAREGLPRTRACPKSDGRTSLAEHRRAMTGKPVARSPRR